MLNVFEKLFGPYPFYSDGYKIVETDYLGMEHQSSCQSCIFPKQILPKLGDLGCFGKLYLNNYAFYLRFYDLQIVKSMRCNLDIGSFSDKCDNNAFAIPKFPSAFSKSIGLTLCGMADDPTSCFLIF